MTNDEKAKAYDMALEAARKELGVDRKEWEVVQRVLHNIFSELRESEDERIRKKCIELIKRVIPSGNNQSIESKDILDCIAYLEKQKYDRMKPIYDARESFESALEKAWNDYHNGYENVDKLEDDYVECAHAKGFREGYLFGIEKQKEQKPNFSEKDSTDFEIEVHEIIAQARNDSRLNDVDVLKQFEEEAAFALMLKANKLIEHKPAEWSEEDEKMLDEIIRDVMTLRNARNLEELKAKIDFIKSLRSYPIQLKEAYKDGFQTVRHATALTFMNHLDENRPDGKMGLSNVECEDIDKAFKENDWTKILRYAEKYGK